MTFFLLNILLAVAWGALMGDFSPLNLLFGFVVGFVTLWLITRGAKRPGYFRRVPQVLEFSLFFLKELVLANLRVARTVLSPQPDLRPAVIGVPLDIHSPPAVALLMNLITLTPGTLSLDISSDRRILFVHALYVTDERRFVREIKDGFERRVKELFE